MRKMILSLITPCRIRAIKLGAGTDRDGTIGRGPADPSRPHTAAVMSFDAVPDPVERVRASMADSVSAAAVTIGADEEIFLCPTCARPLANGVARCPGCGTRLVAGVSLLKVGGFVGLGLVVGLVVAGSVIGATGLASGLGTIAGVQGTPGTVPSTQPSVSAPIVPPGPKVPASAATALHQSTLINQRLLGDSRRLDRVLARTSPQASDIAPLLRSLASTATFGDDIPAALRRWEEGADLADRLESFYASVGRVADQGLSASLQNPRSYISAARRMQKVLDGLVGLDKTARSIATTVGVELPPLVAR